MFKKSILNCIRKDANFLDFREAFESIVDGLQNSLFHLTFPAKCLHCRILLPPKDLVLCPDCSSLLELILFHDRCPSCFNVIEDEYSVPCHRCCQILSPFTQIASAFNYEGPAASLVKQLKYFNQMYLAKGMAGWLVAQFVRLEWPIPDAVVPVPISFIHYLERGYNQSALLAEEMGRLLKRPVWDILRRQNGDFKQASLDLEDRKKLERRSFKMKSGYSIKNKTLLILDDVMTTGSTLQSCGEILQSEGVEALYALTFCRTSLI